MSERAQAWRNAFYAGVFFGVTFAISMPLLDGAFPPATRQEFVGLAVNALIAGGLFGLMIGAFTTSRIGPRAEDIGTDEGEVVEYSGPANHFQRLEGRGGRLAVTSTHLVFEPHAVNVQRNVLRIPRGDIAGVEAVRIAGLIPNGLAVRLKSGDIERFVVNNRAEWIARLAV